MMNHDDENMINSVKLMSVNPTRIMFVVTSLFTKKKINMKIHWKSFKFMDIIMVLSSSSSSSTFSYHALHLVFIDSSLCFASRISSFPFFLTLCLTFTIIIIIFIFFFLSFLFSQSIFDNKLTFFSETLFTRSGKCLAFSVYNLYHSFNDHLILS